MNKGDEAAEGSVPKYSGTLEDCSSWSVHNGDVPEVPVDGVDMIIAVDSTLFGGDAKEYLNTGLYKLLMQLTMPLHPIVDHDWGYLAVRNVRVAVVSSDMGLQWGELYDDSGQKVGGNTGGASSVVPNCSNTVGLDGAFVTSAGDPMSLMTGRIKCEDGKGQCPEGFTCDNDNLCTTEDDSGHVSCPSGSKGIIDSNVEENDFSFPTTVACSAFNVPSSDNCGVSQPLEAVIRGLENSKQSGAPEPFLLDHHLLSIVVISDKDDCSIRDPELFETDEWLGGGDDFPVPACTVPEENEAFLFPASNEDAQTIAKSIGAATTDVRSYYQRYVALKDGRADLVYFAAIVGVPHDTHYCRGDGEELKEAQCLSQKYMEARVGALVNKDGVEEVGIVPACVVYDVDDNEVFSAAPGSRFVKVAQDFGKNGFVFSICNEDWSPSVRLIAQTMSSQQPFEVCLDGEPLWTLHETDNCPECGKAECDVMAVFKRSGTQINDDTCPSALYEDVPSKEVDALMALKEVRHIYDKNNQVTAREVRCPLLQLAAPFECDDLMQNRFWNESRIGWYFCKNVGENNAVACSDGIDNDDDIGPGIISDPEPNVDCDDPDCQYCCNGHGSPFCDECLQKVSIVYPYAHVLLNATIEVRCPVAQEPIDSAECGGEKKTKLGDACTQPAFDEKKYKGLYPEGPVQISFLNRCDCLTYAKSDSSKKQTQYNHICTVPCTGYCPEGYTCEQVIGHHKELPEDVSRWYCVPDEIPSAAL